VWQPDYVIHSQLKPHSVCASGVCEVHLLALIPRKKSKPSRMSLPIERMGEDMLCMASTDWMS
jgi:hypothetical protein